MGMLNPLVLDDERRELNRQMEATQAELQRQTDARNASYENNYEDDYYSSNSTVSTEPATITEFILCAFVLCGSIIATITCFMTVFTPINSFGGGDFSPTRFFMALIISSVISAFVLNITFRTLEFIAETILVIQKFWIPLVVLSALVFAAFGVNHLMA